MTYNICDGGHDRVDLIRQVIASTNADIVLLNEADDESIVRQLGQLLNMQHIWARGSGTKNIALLSRLPILNWQIYNRRPITQALLEAEIQLDSTLLKIYGVHLLPYYMLLPYEFARWRTVSAIVHLTKQAQAPHLLLGDFNAVAHGEKADLTLFPPKTQRLIRLQANRMLNFALRPLHRAHYTDTFRALHQESGWTWMLRHTTALHPAARLDYIFADPQLAAHLRSCDMVTTPPAAQASDHFPLIARFDGIGNEKST